MQTILKSLFGIELEINAALQPGLEHNVAHVRMAWWSEETARLRGGYAMHPLTRALLAQRPAAVSTSSGSPALAGPDIRGLVDIATWDLAAATFDTGRELAGYCDRWAQAVPQLAATWAAPERSAEIARHFGHGLGVALCELEMLVSLQDSARQGRVRIPLDELTALDVAPALWRSRPGLRRCVPRLRERHRQLRRAVLESCALLRSPAERAAQRGLLVWAALMQQHSRRAEAGTA